MDRHLTSKNILISALTLTLCLLHMGAAWATELRYIRIGEHKEFTRIVFEFQGPAVFKEPATTGRGTFSIVFVDTTTTLPKKILSETSKRVDTIAFIQDKSNLTTTITLAFPYFKTKAFSLSNPARVVLDVNMVNAPAKETVFEEPITQEPVPKPKAEIPQKTKVEPKPPPPPVVVENAPVAAEVPQRPILETDIKPEGKPPKTAEPARSPPAKTEAEKSPPAPGPGFGHKSKFSFSDFHDLRTYLLVVLVVLSLVIISLLVFIIARKGSVAHQTSRNVAKTGPEFYFDDTMDEERNSDEVDESLGATDYESSMAAINAKIKKEFSKIQQP